LTAQLAKTTGLQGSTGTIEEKFGYSGKGGWAMAVTVILSKVPFFKSEPLG
jgi:hypothetical protein